MTQQVSADDHQRVIVTGFRKGGGVPLPYVYVGRLDDNDNLTDVITMGTRSAQELGEILRSEAEFAASPREEEVTA